MKRLFAKASRGRGGPEGVAVKVRGAGRKREKGGVRARMPRYLALGVLVAAVFYVLAHLSIIEGVWPAHGTAPGAGRLFIRDAVALIGWLALFPILQALRFRGSWVVIALPVLIFLFARPTLFQIFTDPGYQARGSARAEANALKAERSQLTTILRAYDAERQEIVFNGPAPEIPEPVEVLRQDAQRQGTALAWLSAFSVMVAPLALLLAFMAARREGALRFVRRHRRIVFGVAMAIFFVLALFPGARATGKVAGTTPWELLLPVFVAIWAAVLADDAYNLARPGQVVAPRRVLSLLVYGALPIVPFLVIRELGLSVVLAGSLAMMLLVGTRRGWWAALMLGVWLLLVAAVFQVDDRSATRLALAVEPYRDISAMTAEEAEDWAAKLHQIKLFDANVLEGGAFGAGAGRGHAETAPNAADDGYITAIAAQWGLAGALALVLLYTAFIVGMLTVAVRERSAFERSLVTGMAMLLAIPFWLATLGGIRVIPLTGVAAAFAAHGGAKLLASVIAVGIVAAVSHRRGEADRLRASESATTEVHQPGVRIR